MSVSEGDIIRVLNIPKEYTEHTYVGAICEVLGVHDSGITVSAPIPNGYGGSQFLVYIAEGDYEVITEEGDSMTNTKAQVGDLIRIVNAVVDEQYDNGDIFEVTDLAHWDGDVYGVNPKYDEALYIEEAEFVIHRKAGEEDAETVDFPEHTEGLSYKTFLGESDAVSHPNHYTQGRFETIEVIEEITQGYSDGYVAYCVGNALKYLARAPYKHGEPTEDLAKAAKYLAFADAYLTQNEK